MCGKRVWLRYACVAPCPVLDVGKWVVVPVVYVAAGLCLCCGCNNVWVVGFVIVRVFVWVWV